MTLTLARPSAALVLLCLVALLTLGACGACDPGPSQTCFSDQDCPLEFRCADQVCIFASALIDASANDAPPFDLGGRDQASWDGDPADRRIADVNADASPGDAVARDSDSPDQAPPDVTPTDSGWLDVWADDSAGLDAGGPTTSDSGSSDQDGGSSSQDSALGDAGLTADASEPGDGGRDASLDAGMKDAASLPAPALFAVHPSIARVGDTIYLEGIFAAGSMRINIGDVSVDVDPGASQVRLPLVVPAGATSGVVQIVAPESSQAIPITIRSYRPGLAAFSPELPQASYARQSPALSSARRRFEALHMGQHVYLLGGIIDGDDGTEVLRARAHADGALGAFRSHPYRLSQSRRGLALAQIGRCVFALGGADSSDAPTQSTEYACLGARGLLGAFSPGPDLTTARAYARAVVIGSSLYVIGGRDGPNWRIDTLRSVERATIASDGSLGPFADLGDVLIRPRDRAEVAVVGQRLYVFGGTSETTSAEYASISPGGSLANFTAASSSLRARRSMQALVLPNEVCLIGGEDGATAHDDVDCAAIQANGALGAFAPRFALNTPRSEFALARVGDRVWLLGGKDQNGAPTLRSANADVRVETDIDSFAAAPHDLPHALGGPGCGVVGHRLYLFGGLKQDGTPVPQLSDQILYADIKADGALGSFVVDSGSIGVARSHVRVLVSEDQVYLVGGVDSGGLHGKTYVATMGPGDQLGAFSEVSGSHVTHDGAAVFVAGGVFYQHGGAAQIQASRQDQTTLPLDPESSVYYRTIALSRTWPSAAILANRVYVFGGASAQAMIAPSISADDLSMPGGVNPVPGNLSLVTPRARAMPLVLGDKLYIFGGHALSISGSETAAPGTERASLNASGQLGAPQDASPPLPADVQEGACLVQIGNWVHLIGGGVGLVSRPNPSLSAKHYRAAITSP